MRFDEYVKSVYKNDPFIMMDKFSSEISEVLSTFEIDWSETKKKVVINHRLKGSFVTATNEHARGRVSVMVTMESYDLKYEGKPFTVLLPVVGATNFRSEFKESISGKPGRTYVFLFQLIWAEFEAARSTGGELVAHTIDMQALEEQKDLAAKAVLAKEEEARTSRHKDYRWYYSSKSLSEWPYFTNKLVPFIFNYIDIRLLRYKEKMWAGVPLVYCNNVFAGLQRFDQAGNKIFRKSYNPLRAVYRFGQLKDGEPIILQESGIDAAMSFHLTKITSLGVLFADNFTAVAQDVRHYYPNSPVLIIYDDDVNSAYNSGKLCAEAAAEIIGREHCVLKTLPFTQAELKAKKKDLTDYHIHYGIAATKTWLYSVVKEAFYLPT